MHQKPENSRSNMQALLLTATLCFIAFQSGKAQGMLLECWFNFETRFIHARRLATFGVCLQKVKTVCHTMPVSPYN